METTARTLTSYGNCTLVQFEITPESQFSFKPGGPELMTGGLVITESGGFGEVGKLVALNNTGSFLLLTDADILAGAKQNRVLNKSVLLPPYSKTMLDVSCIERGRWHYTSPTFTSPAAVADPDLRKIKARSVSSETTTPEAFRQTQQTVWSSIESKMRDERFASPTDNYSDLVSHQQGKPKIAFPACEPENGCNGLAVLMDGKIACVDIFGTAEVFRHYFPKLRDSAFLQARIGTVEKGMDRHEAFYRVSDLLDQVEMADQTPDPDYTGAGSLVIRETGDVFGIELAFDGQLIHSGFFVK